jgi:CubicO group peptidase (beta-lactamase class C family)
MTYVPLIAFFEIPIMSGETNEPTRRQALAGFGTMGGLSVATSMGAPFDSSIAEAQTHPQPSFRPPEEKVPVNGKAGPGLEPFDEAILKIMDRHGVPGAALAIAKDGKLVFAKGFGWSDVSAGTPVRPDTLFGLASLSKSITAIGVLQLVEREKLGLDDKVFSHLKHIKAPTGVKVDPRLFEVTIRQCLNHSGGWDRNVNGDPINWEPQISRAMRLRPPISPAQFISFAMSLALDFAPGTDIKYSNVGYILLGEVIAKVSGMTYERFIIDNVFKPMDIRQAALHKLDNKYLATESLRYLAGSLIPLPPLQQPMVNATGGWSASAVDMVRLLTNLDGSRGKPVLADKTHKLMIAPPPSPLKPLANGMHVGLGFDSVLANDKGYACFKDGSIQGMRTFMKRLPTGVNWALLYNASMEFDPLDTQIASGAVHDVKQLIEGFVKYPDIDLFGEYR